jgi:hypothetical protein
MCDEPTTYDELRQELFLLRINPEDILIYKGNSIDLRTISELAGGALVLRLEKDEDLKALTDEELKGLGLQRIP